MIGATYYYKNLGTSEQKNLRPKPFCNYVRAHYVIAKLKLESEFYKSLNYKMLMIRSTFTLIHKLVGADKLEAELWTFLSKFIRL